MNERILELAKQAGIYQPDRFAAIDGSNQMEKFAELILKDAFIIMKEAMIDIESTNKVDGSSWFISVDEVIADRLKDAACDVCDKFDLLGPIYEG